MSESLPTTLAEKAAEARSRALAEAYAEARKAAAKWSPLQVARAYHLAYAKREDAEHAQAVAVKEGFTGEAVVWGMEVARQTQKMDAYFDAAPHVVAPLIEANYRARKAQEAWEARTEAERAEKERATAEAYLAWKERGEGDILSVEVTGEAREILGLAS